MLFVGKIEKGDFMTVLKIISILLGTAFSLFGYFIYFQKKYHLINGFEQDYQSGLKDEHYARRIGLIELALGMVLLAVGAVLIIFV